MHLGFELEVFTFTLGFHSETLVLPFNIPMQIFLSTFVPHPPAMYSTCVLNVLFLLHPTPSQPHPQTDLLGQAEGSNAHRPETAEHGEDGQAEVVVG